LKPEYILLGLTPLFLLCIAVEFVRHRKNYHVKDSLSSAALGAMHQFADILAITALLPVFSFVNQYSIWSFEITPVALVVGFLVQDFLYYWFHRASHNIHWLWAAHVVHHSSPHMNFTTAFRQSFMYPLAGMWVFWLPMALIGFTPELIFAIVAINLAFQFFVHTQIVGKLGPLEYLFNTPSHHRVHHSMAEPHLDKNYAGVLIIWDRLFGTFVEESQSTPCLYGAAHHRYHVNPVKATFEEWGVLYNKMVKAPGIKRKIMALFSYPQSNI